MPNFLAKYFYTNNYYIDIKTFLKINARSFNLIRNVPDLPKNILQIQQTEDYDNFPLILHI